MMLMHERRSSSIVALVGAFAVASFAGGCEEKSKLEGLGWELTHYKEYQPPASASTDTARYFPSLYVRSERDSLMGIVNPNPQEPFPEVAEASPENLVMQLRFSRQALQERAGTSVRVPLDVNLVLDRKMSFGQIMEAVYLSNSGSFMIPHLITASGREHLIEPPRVHREYGPVGWSAWIWWMSDQSMKWMAWPDSAGRVAVRTLASEGGAANLSALVDSLHGALDGKPHIPPAAQRLIGFWAYDGLSYPQLMQFMDVLRYPEKGQPLAGRITLLQGQLWAPPESGEQRSGAGS